MYCFIASVRFCFGKMPLLAGILSCSIALQAAQPRVLISLKSNSGYWKDLAEAAQESANALGAAAVVRSPPAEEYPAAQLKLLQTALAEQHYDALIVAAINPQVIQPILQGAMQNGTRVVVLEAPGGGYDGDCYVVSSNQAAVQCVDAVAAAIGEKGGVIAFRQAQIGGPRQRREQAVLTTLAKYKNLIVYNDTYLDTNIPEDEKKIEVAVAKHGDCKALVTTSAFSALAALRVLAKPEAEGKVKMAGVGYRLPGESIKAFETGALVAWAVEAPEPIGKRAMECAVDLCAGRSVDRLVETESVLVTKANVTDPAIQKRIDPVK